ncbi:MAG: type II secretion system F family protein [Acidimicrobiia bacterium]
MNALLSAVVALVVVAAAAPLATRPARPLDDPPSRRTSRGGGRTVGGARWGIVMTVAAVLVGITIVGPTGVIAIGLVVLSVRVARRRRQERRQHALLEALAPELIELVLVGVHAGLTTPQAMLRLSEIAPVPLRPALDSLGSRVRSGERFADALRALTEEAGAAYRPLVFTLALAERTGDPIGPVLDRLADEARRHRRRLADASARELPVRLAVPLVACTLPAFVLLTIAPVLAGALSSLRGAVP